MIVAQKKTVFVGGADPPLSRYPDLQWLWGERPAHLLKRFDVNTMQDLLQEVSRNLEKYLASPPELTKYTVFSAEVETVKPELVTPA